MLLRLKSPLWYFFWTTQNPIRKLEPSLGWITLPKTNISPENRPLEKEIPIGNHHFQGRSVSFREGISWRLPWRPSSPKAPLNLSAMCREPGQCPVRGPTVWGRGCRDARHALAILGSRFQVSGGMEATQNQHKWNDAYFFQYHHC